MSSGFPPEDSRCQEQHLQVLAGGGETQTLVRPAGERSSGAATGNSTSIPQESSRRIASGPAMAPRRRLRAGCVKKGKRGLEPALVHSSREVEAAHKFVG